MALCEIISNIIRGNHQFRDLIKGLRALTPIHDEDDGMFPPLSSHIWSKNSTLNPDPYIYDLPSQFEREKHIRAPCGYVGLKNLSNTCYFNSLLTQLFMNLKFRQFMFKIRVDDPNGDQELLYQTQKLFGFLQDSARRFYDPTECVASIKTYEDATIDIHNQMDVDEFYNLLFDRWEGQLKSHREKKEFRSLYGGQLVQQVKSKECEHISERLEPFSAIQCDIKGKGTLQESLQAYVDGEIMEGDNKYKCSTCDRHVDAVKRACLKEVPDNLIFHLKRFEFNLRTMTRSKINDHFAFPPKIDMRPFTINHLDGRSEDEEEDIFELVGVLVHAGTAESGHYYSYIRPRPSTLEGWVEFNDDVVTEWDAQQMEALCFGGYEYRANFDAYDRSWSAYMLFYQRSTVLQEERRQLQKVKSAEPAKARMPADLEQYIADENLRMTRRHCLYDPHHIPWVTQILNSMSWQHSNRCSLDHGTENSAMQMALGHLDQVASRARDTPDFIPFIIAIRQSCQSCVRCSIAVYSYFRVHAIPFRNMLQRNPDQLVRSEIGALLILASGQIKQHAPSVYGLGDVEDESLSSDTSSSTAFPDEPVIFGMVEILKRVFSTFWQGLSLRAWQEIFGFMVNFGKLGRVETAMMLEADFMYKLLCIVVVDPGHDAIPALYQRLLQAINRRPPTRPVSYENVLVLLDMLLGAVDPSLNNCVPRPDGRIRAFVEKGGPIPLTDLERETIMTDWKDNQGNILVDKLGYVGHNHPQTVGSIVAKLIRSGAEMDARVFLTLKVNIQGSATGVASAPYLRMAIKYCRYSAFEERISKLILHICRQCSKGLSTSEGCHYFNFHQQVFELERVGTQESLESVRLQGYANIHLWAPGLLTYHDPVTRNYTEEFLAQRIFSLGEAQTANVSEDEAKIRSAIYEAARHLAFSCVEHLRKNHVERGNQLTKDCVESIRRVISNCERYFRIPGEADAAAFANFNSLRNCEYTKNSTEYDRKG